MKLLAYSLADFILYLFVCSIVFAVAHTSYAMQNNVYQFTTTLYPGAQGKAVEELQKRLMQFPGVYPESQVTGRLGPTTVAAIKRLQKIYGLEITGSFGPKTRAILNRESPPSTTVTSTPAQDAPDTSPTVASSNPVFDSLLKKIEALTKENISIRQSMAFMNRINNLSGTALNNVTVSGITGIASGDLPSIDLASKVSGVLPVANGGTALSSVTPFQIFAGNNAGTAWTQIATSSLNINTDNLIEGVSNLFHTDARVQSFIHASTTIPKTYTSNTFTGANTFSGATTFGSLNGPLQVNAGVLSATTSIGVLYGGTGLTGAPGYGQVAVGNASCGYTLTATSSLKISPKKFVNITVPSGNTIANTTTETAFASTYTIPANTLEVGDIIRIKLWGVYSNTLTPPTVIGKVKIGSTVFATTGTITGGAAASNAGWSGEESIVVQSIGSSGVVDAQAFLEFATAATAALTINVPNASTLTLDTTADQAITVTVQWGTASASNTITLRQMIVEILK